MDVIRTSAVLTEVLHERERQIKKHGDVNHRPEVWLMILGEEVGEVNKAALENHLQNGISISNYRDELIQVAASAVAAVECLDKQYENASKGVDIY
jgi:NTP pyrophosphatase (non-canonical NTP hydrolase)